MKRFLKSFAVVIAMALPTIGAAHPHIFVETGLKPVLDDTGRLIGIEVAWRYDELYSLLVLEDKALDHDYDGKLIAEEMAQLTGFDQNWIEGYVGDLFIHQGDATLTLGPPEGRGASFEDGKITSVHFRRVDGAKAGQPWLIQAYDPTYYTAYDLGLGVEAPQGCDIKVTQADLDRAYTLVEEALYATPADPEGNFPEVGEAFADKVELSCAVG